MSEHEKECPHNPDNGLYRCMHDGCRFQGRFEVVEAHEDTCKHKPAEANTGEANTGEANTGEANTGEAAKEFERFAVTAEHDFTADIFGEPGSDILFFQTGDVIQVVETDEEGHWWYGSMDNGEQGWFPTEYVQRLKHV